MFFKNFKCKSIVFVKFIEFVDVSASRDVFTGSLVQSVQELWPIKSQATIVASKICKQISSICKQIYCIFWYNEIKKVKCLIRCI